METFFWTAVSLFLIFSIFGDALLLPLMFAAVVLLAHWYRMKVRHNYGERRFWKWDT